MRESLFRLIILTRRTETEDFRVRLIDAHLRNGVINYEITSDAIEFYLDTKR